MSTENDGGPAFPQHGWSSDPEVLKRMSENGGMSLRDWFAGQALIGVLANNELAHSVPDVNASSAYAIADAMLKARGP